MVTQILFVAVAAFVILVIGWWILQEFWDLKLFEHRGEREFSMNLSTVQALGIFRHTPGIVAIDVRPASQYKEQHLPGALNAPFENGILDTTEIDKISRGTPILLYCAGGYRSRKALKSLEEAGFLTIYHLNRGLMMWRLFSGPIEKGEESQGSNKPVDT